MIVSMHDSEPSPPDENFKKAVLGYYYPPHIYCGKCGEPLRQDGHADKKTRTAVLYCTNSNCECHDQHLTVHALTIELTPKDA